MVRLPDSELLEKNLVQVEIVVLPSVNQHVISQFVQFPDNQAKLMVEEFIAGKRER